MNKQALWALSFILISTSSLFALFEDSDDERAKTLKVPKTERHVKVSLASPLRSSMPLNQTVTGITEPRLKITLNILSEGTVHLKSYDGQQVHKGDTVAVISNDQRENMIRSFNENIKLLEHQIKAGKEKLYSAKEMLKLGIVSKNTVLDARNALEDKKVVLNQTKIELGKLELQNTASVIKAPADGYIEALLPDGSYVSYGQVLCKIIDSRVQTRLYVPPIFAKELHIGQKVEILGQGITSTAKIVAIMPQSNDNLLDVIAFPEKSLPVGLHIEAQIEMSETKGWIIPKDSIVLVQNRPAVYLIENNKAVLHFVTVQKDMIDKVLVTDHFQPHDNIALKNAYMLHDGASVEVVK